jgi:hypothetical protein
MNFGNRALNTTSAVKNAELKNTNPGAIALSVNISSIALAVGTNFAISKNGCPATLGWDRACFVSVTFTPTQLGPLSDTLIFTDNAAGSPQTIALSGGGVEQATLTPGSLYYPETEVGGISNAMKVTLRNNLPTMLTGISYSTTGPFAVPTSTCSTTLNKKGICTISVTFLPTEEGTANGTLSVSDSASNSPQTVSLSGTPLTGRIILMPSSLTFGVTKVGNTSGPTNVTLYGRQGDIPDISYSTTGPFAVYSSTCPTTLYRGTQCRIQVTFTPTQSGTATGTLSVSGNAFDSPQSVSLSGSTPTAQAALTPSSLTFAATEVGDTSDPGNVTLYVRKADITDISYSTTGPFAVYSSTCPATLNPGRSCRVRVTFTPTQSGTATGTLSVSDSAHDSPQTVSLSGTGTTQPVFVSPTSVNFGEQSVGTTSVAKKVTLFNEGATQITVTSVNASADFAITANYCLDGVKPNSHCYVDVVFSPTQSGALSGTLTFVDNATGSPQTASLSGTGD